MATKYREDDVALLLPSLQLVHNALKAKMVELGHKPCTRDTRRSAKEAEANAKRGVGIKDSIHEYDAAFDMICDVHGWACASSPKLKCRFFVDLRREGLALGLFRGPEWDWPHLQAIPATKRAQDGLRALGKGEASRDARDAYVRRWLR